MPTIMNAKHDESLTCPFCELRCAAEFLCCPRCGGRLRPPTSQERILTLLEQARILIGHRVWHGLRGLLETIADRLAEAPDLVVSASPALAWLGEAMEALALVVEPKDYVPVVNLAKTLMPLLSEKAFPVLRTRLRGLTTLVDSLTAAETQSRQRGEKPAAEKLEVWLTKVTTKAGLEVAEGRAALYACPNRWPTLAAALNPAAFQKVAWIVTASRAEQEFRADNYGSARKLFESILAKTPGCVRALEGLALTQTKLNNTSEGIRLYREAIRYGATDARTFNNFAWHLSLSGKATASDLEECLWAARRAVQQAPLAGFWDTLAEVYARIGNVPDAIAATREALRSNPENEIYRERMTTLCKSLPMPHAMPAPKVEEAEDEIDFEFPDLARHSAEEDSGLALDLPSADATDSSEFELSLDASSCDAMVLDASDSEFELSLDAESGIDFELPSPGILESKRHDDSLRLPPEASQHPWPAATGRGTFTASPAVQRDPVECTVFAVPEVKPGDFTLVNVFAHLATETEAVRAAAREFDADAQRRGTTSLATEIAQGTKLSFELQAPGLAVSQPRLDLVWRGKLAYVSFDLSVPEDASPRTLIARILVFQQVEARVDGKTESAAAAIGEIKFKMKIVGADAKPVLDPVPAGEARRYHKAFVSYASPDRKEVLKRVQMLTAAGIKFFQDVLDLEPGDRWERQLYRHIDESDVLFLFWSPSARDSKWVEAEWRYGLEKKGDEFIRPVVLQAADPPGPLRHLHFNDRVLLVMGAD